MVVNLINIFKFVKTKDLIMKINILLISFLLILSSCNNQIKNVNNNNNRTTEESPVFFKLSLAQWSLHIAMNDDKTIDPMDFAQVAKEMGFEGLEYVSTMYKNQMDSIGMEQLLKSLLTKSVKYQLENLVIMVDGEGELSDPDITKRSDAVEKHKKWVDAAKVLGCHSIRVNLFGTTDPILWKTASIDGLSRLSKYAKTKNINVIVENHGYLSSNAALLVEVIQAVGMSNCGTLPDFGNFCLRREDGQQWNSACLETYNIYQGVSEMMPYAKAVSAKSYDFDLEGNETTIDYNKMLTIVKKAGYTGYIGVEYEKKSLNERDGILATKNLLIKAAKEM